MRLLTIMAALLLSFSASSQDLIEYRDFKFYKNGSEISFEEVTTLTKEYGVARVAFIQGTRDYTASESTLRATRRNLTNGALTFTGGYGALIGLAASFFSEDPKPLVLSAISAGGMVYFSRLVGSKKEFRERADKKFNKTAQKLNEAVQKGNSQ